ncbi:MAG: hypothetical protein LBE14_06015 [Treponema sp.]|nr:hypothetical protein [Treponema sp.]
MPFPPDLLTKLKNLGAAAAGFLKGLGEKGGRCFTRVRGVLQEKLPQGGKQRIFIGLGAALALLLLALLAVLVVLNHNAGAGFRAAGDKGGVPQKTPIPPEELFLPAEPDFLPEVMLERERRQAWTAEDAEPYWQNPLKTGEEPWRDRVEAAVDELLERVP